MDHSCWRLSALLVVLLCAAPLAAQDDGWGPPPTGSTRKKPPVKPGRGQKVAPPKPIVIPPGKVGPKMVVDNENFDWGTIIQGTPAEHVFRVTNEGDMDLEIIRVKPG